MKRIVLCADGTWNQLDQVNTDSGKRRPTNVTKLARAVRTVGDDGVHQVVYYHSGVGTGGPQDRLTGGAFGHGMQDNIRALYRFILYNHEPGDKLYLFGFSRGAFTVRSLAGFMHRYGLVGKSDDFWVPEMYECYENDIAEGTAGWNQRFISPTSGKPRIQKARPCPTIDFLGVWDTVGSLGAPGMVGKLFNDKRYVNHNVELNHKIAYAAHALALDERREPFAPSMWRKPAGWAGTLVQTWFAGVHSNVGGSYDPDGLANVALAWMVAHAQLAGLQFDPAFLHHYAPRHDSTLNDSMTAAYKLMRPFQPPFTRTVGVGADACETLHRSVLMRCDQPGPGQPPYVPPQGRAAIDALPVVDTPVVDTPVLDTPVVDTPVVDAPAFEAGPVDAQITR